MLSVKNMCALALMGGAFAAEHHHHEGKRDVAYVTVQQTVWVTADGKVVPTPAAEAPKPSAAPVKPAKVVAKKPSIPQKETSKPPAPASSKAPETSPSSEPSSSASGDKAQPTEGHGDSGALGITYSPYNKDHTCKSADQVKGELQKLSGYKVIRLYGTDCSQVENVYNALQKGQKLFLGVFDVSDVSGECKKIAQAINNDWDVVHTVSIGNELVNGGQASVDQVKQYVSTGRDTLRGLGYQGPVNTVDTFIATINNPGLCDVGDYVSVNAHAFFDGNVDAAGAGDWLMHNIQRVSATCGGKKTIITESGWPSQGQTNGKCVPGADQQKAAIDSIKQSCGDDTFLFTAYNDYWKAPGAFAAEQYWGLYDN